MGNGVTMELAAINEKNPCGNRGFHLLCQSLAPDGTKGQKVEAAGIEPASSDISMPASTCIVGCLGFAELALTDEVQLRLAENLI